MKVILKNTKMVFTTDINPNLLDPSKVTMGAYLSRTGDEGTFEGSTDRFVTDYIPVTSEGLITDASLIAGYAQGMASFAVYNAEKRLLRVETDAETPKKEHYSYREGDAYVRFCFFTHHGSLDASRIAVIKGDVYKFKPFVE